MSLSTMYKGKNGSPKTTLSAAITATATSMKLADAAVLPAAPNICVIGHDINAEIVSYTAISGNTVSGLVRGLNGTTAAAWAAGSIVARNFTSLDYDTLVDNITALNNDKQNKLSFDTTPTSNSTKPVTSGGVYNALALKANSADLGSLAGKSKADLTADVSGILPIANGGTGNATGLAASATKLATARTVRTNLESTATASFNGTANIAPGVTGVLPVANGGTGNATGLAASATRLATARTVRTNLASTSTASFDGSANITPGVTGTLPIANGGTGNTTGTATLATTTEDKTNALYPVGVTSDGVTALKRDTSITMKAGTITAALSGNASTATKLKTARTIQTDLGSAASASFDGSANITPGITGTLPVANGGTGAATAAEALTNLGAAASSHTHDDRYYTESETDTKLAAKAPVASPVHTGKIDLKDSSADISAETLTATRNNYIAVKDKNDRYLAWMTGSENTAGLVTASLSARRYNNSANVDNSLSLKVAADGTRSVAVSDKKIWRNAIGASSGIWPVAVGGTGNANGTVEKLTTARTVKTNLESADAASFDGSADIIPGVSGVLPIANGGTGNTTGLAASATKLATARTVRTNLASTSTASFNGTANIAPGVTGILPVANGGTGNENGLVASATKLETARAITANLASTAAASFDGSADVTPGVSGVLPIANGGTGASTLANARKALYGSNLASTAEYIIAITSNYASGGYVKLPLPAAMGGTGNANGTVGKLTTARTVQTNLASSEAASFDGSDNITPGVTGILPIANGGTGGTDSGWKPITNAEIFTGTIYYRKIGPFMTVCTANVKLVTALAAAKTSVTLGSAVIPSGYRPKVNMYAFTQQSATASAIIIISTGGNITFYNCSNTSWSTSTVIAFSASYIIA